MEFIKMIIAVDFDGTCVEHKYPEIGAEIPGAVQTLQELSKNGNLLILWTCREDTSEKKYLTEAVNWFKLKSIPLYGINSTPDESDFRKNGGRKVYADCYIDDKNINGFIGWKKIQKILLK